MSDDSRLSADQRTAFLFAILGAGGWYVAAEAGVGQTWRLVVLFGVGFVVPTLLNAWRNRRGSA